MYLTRSDIWRLSIYWVSGFELARSLSLSTPHETLDGSSHQQGLTAAFVELNMASPDQYAVDDALRMKRQSQDQGSFYEIQEMGDLDGIEVFTVATRMNKTLEIPGSPRVALNNLAGDEEWKYRARTKNLVFQDYLDAHMDTPDKVVIMVDGGDVVFGGCDPKKFREYYEKVVNASGGAKLVLGAEMGCYPENEWHDCFDLIHNQEPFESTRQSVLKEFGFTVRKPDKAKAVIRLNAVNSWVPQPTTPTPSPPGDDMYGNQTICHVGHYHPTWCSQPPRYQFANYGFAMGPVREIKKLVDEVNMRQEQKPMTIDQGVVVQYHRKHPDLVTLDYSGSLMLSMHNFEGDVNGRIPEWLTMNQEQKNVFNQRSGRVACFLHGNGRAKPVVDKMARLMKEW